jgi:hypothetical protein
MNAKMKRVSTRSPTPLATVSGKVQERGSDRLPGDSRLKVRSRIEAAFRKAADRGIHQVPQLLLVTRQLNGEPAERPGHEPDQ